MKSIRQRNHIIVYSIISSLVLASGGISLYKHLAPEPPPPERTARVSIIKPSRKDLQKTLILNGILESDTMVSVIPRVTGTLLTIRVDEGASVKKGELLAQIDPQSYDLQLKTAQSNWNLAESNLARAKRLSESSGISEKQMEEIQTSRDAAYSAYELAKLRRNYTEIRSPIDGMIFSRFADPGNLVGTSAPLFTIGNPSKTRVKVRVPEKYWDVFQAPQSIQVRIWRTERLEKSGARDASIFLVSPYISSQGRTFKVTSVPKSTEDWPVGSQMKVEFILKNNPGMWSLPLQTVDGNDMMSVVEAGVIHRVEAPKIYRDSNYIGVPASWVGNSFVLNNGEALRDGQKVVPVGGDASH